MRMGNDMTEQTVTAYIDEALRRFAHRELVAGTEVIDFLLDLRAALTREAALAGLELETVA